MRIWSIVMIVAVNAGVLTATRQEPRVERAEVERIVRTLASDDMEGRSALGNAIERAAAFIGSEFEAIGLQPLPEQTGFLQRFEADVRGRSAQMANVVGMIPGRRSNEFVLFSAHYDHVGFQPGRAVDGDSIANGANDNASGTAAVISLARYFKALGQPERTLLFAAFTAEEIGGFGSRYFSNQLDPDEIVAMFNIEMIGKPAREGPNTAWITGFDRSDFGQILQRAVVGTQYEFYPDPYPDQNLFFRSDNATLARLGVPAHSISTTPIDVDTDYHRVTDEVETLDLDHMTNTIRAIATGARTIVSGAATPIRVTDVSR